MYWKRFWLQEWKKNQLQFPRKTQKKSGCSRIVRHCSHLENKPHSHGAWKSLNCFLSSCPHPLFLMGSPLMYNSVTIVAELVRRIEGKQVRPWPQRWVENFTCHTDILYYNDINYYCVDSVHLISLGSYLPCFQGKENIEMRSICFMFVRERFDL